MKHQAREITTPEARHLFLTHMAHLVGYWENEKRAPTSKEKLEGLLFSILTALDGAAMALPGYQVIPKSHPDDIDFAKSEGFDYYPEQPSDIGTDANLHDEINAYLTGKAPKFADLYDFTHYLGDQPLTRSALRSDEN